jgi:hypothetical protein
MTTGRPGFLACGLLRGPDPQRSFATFCRIRGTSSPQREDRKRLTNEVST